MVGTLLVRILKSNIDIKSYFHDDNQMHAVVRRKLDKLIQPAYLTCMLPHKYFFDCSFQTRLKQRKQKRMTIRGSVFTE